MLVLSLDTSGAAVSVALVESSTGAVRAARQIIGSHGHGEHLSPAIAECLEHAEVGPSALGAIVAGLGPGPFTGLRVGLVTAAALGDALGIPTYGVCSLDGIEIPDVGDVLVATDARRKEVYWARYRDGVRVAGPAVDLPAEVVTATSTGMVGAGARQYAEVLGLPLLGDDPSADHPDPVALVALAGDRIAAQAASEVLVPLYLRRPDAVPPASMKTVSQ